MRKSFVAATALALLPLGVLPVAPAQAADSIVVSTSGGSLTITASGTVSPGLLVVRGGANQVAVFPDADSGSAISLTAGSGCRLANARVTCEPSAGSFTSITISLMLASFPQGPLGIAVTPDTRLPVTFFGSFDRDEFYGGPGSDTILGYGGDDALFGGDGDDAIFGGDGRDAINGEGGSDTVYGDAQADVIVADQDGKSTDWINCNNYMPGVVGTNNDPANPPTNDVFFDKGTDRITDCGEPGAPNVTAPPTLAGTPTVGRNYAAGAGTYSGKGLSMSYTWFSCPSQDDVIPMLDEDPAGKCAEVASLDGAPGLTYKPRAADEGRYLRLRTTARNNAGFTTVASAASPAVKPVKR